MRKFNLTILLALLSVWLAIPVYADLTPPAGVTEGTPYYGYGDLIVVV